MRNLIGASQFQGVINMSKEEIYCSVCVHQDSCEHKNPDTCLNFKIKQDTRTWYLERNSGMRHPLDMD